VARDLAAFTDSCILLDLDERADLGFIANLATVQIDELGELDVSPKLHVRRDAHIRIHECNDSRPTGDI
jgi:hypothetical protein